jgi:hypothetical protein
VFRDNLAELLQLIDNEQAAKTAVPVQEVALNGAATAHSLVDGVATYQLDAAFTVANCLFFLAFNTRRQLLEWNASAEGINSSIYSSLPSY